MSKAEVLTAFCSWAGRRAREAVNVSAMRKSKGSASAMPGSIDATTADDEPIEYQIVEGCTQLGTELGQIWILNGARPQQR
ncbi:hypothetical protein [Methylobacterium durans]|uniref:hypothetical protein n=1 Tax=Methylobacterium durans TaxID=2202825 RepID=UPI0013A55C2F|nr:hypothetical protein [Methylobacterium durans]